MQKKKMQIWILFYSVLFALGSILFYVAWTQYQKSQNLLNKGERTTANVVAYKNSHGKNGALFAPIFEFKDRSEELHTYASKINSNPPQYEIGEKVEIVFNGKKYDELKVISFWGLYRVSVILLMIASPMLVLGGAYLLYVNR